MVRLCDKEDAQWLDGVINHPDAKAAAIWTLESGYNFDVRTLFSGNQSCAVLSDSFHTVVVIFQPFTNISVMGHLYTLPTARGKYAVRIFREAVQWVWGNTLAQKITAFIPVLNRRAVRILPMLGLRIEGTLLSACRYGPGRVLCDLYISGMNKE